MEGHSHSGLSGPFMHQGLECFRKMPKVFNETDKAYAIKLHRKEWRRLAHNPAMGKRVAVVRLGFRNILHACFLCQYAYDVARENGMPEGKAGGIGDGSKCDYCPVVWPEGCCTGGDHLYDRWLKNDSVSERIRLAKRIAELPEKSTEAVFDGLAIEDDGDCFFIKATKNGQPIPQSYVARILKDGSGMQLEIGLNSHFARGDSHKIKILPGKE